jgi:hypothetical protein
MPTERKIAVEPMKFGRALARKTVGKYIAAMLFEVADVTLPIIEHDQNFPHIIFICSFTLRAQCGREVIIHPKVSLTLNPRNSIRLAKKIVKSVYYSFIEGDDELGLECNGKYCTEIISGIILLCYT